MLRGHAHADLGPIQAFPCMDSTTQKIYLLKKENGWHTVAAPSRFWVFTGVRNHAARRSISIEGSKLLVQVSGRDLDHRIYFFRHSRSMRALRSPCTGTRL